MKRTDFYTAQYVDGVAELDHMYNNLSGMSLKYQTSYYTVTDNDILRPDLISFKIYGTVEYWWFICLVNGINNPFTDLSTGQKLLIPNTMDAFAYAKEKRIR